MEYRKSNVMILLLALFSMHCEEKLPVRVDPVQVASPFLELTAGLAENLLPYKNEASNGVVFKVGIKNIFDETFDNDPYIDGHVKIWMEPDVFVRTIDFHIEDINELTLDPLDTAWIDIYWDQKDDSGEPIWDLCNDNINTLEFKVAAKIKFYRNIPYRYSDTLNFTVKYDKSLSNRSTINFNALEIKSFERSFFTRAGAFFDVRELNHCWICGTYGMIYLSRYKIEIVSSSGGVLYNFYCSINKQESGTSVNLTDIAFIDTTTGWCVGEKGTILKTTNGGKRWEQKQVAFSSDIRSVFFFSENLGWVTGDSGLVAKTTDGGNTWMRQESGTQVNLHRIYFSRNNYGFAVGGLGTILGTTDGGDSWNVYRKDYFNRFTDVYCESISTDIIVAGTEGFFKQFDTKLQLWKDFNITMPVGINRLFFINRNKGFIAGNKGWISALRGGYSMLSDFKMTTGTLNCIHDIEFIDNNVGIAVGDGETVFISPSGDTWYCIRNYSGEFESINTPGTPNYIIKHHNTKKTDYIIHNEN